MTSHRGRRSIKNYTREAFDCGEEALNGFLRRYARKGRETLANLGTVLNDLATGRVARHLQTTAYTPNMVKDEIGINSS